MMFKSLRVAKHLVSLLRGICVNITIIMLCYLSGPEEIQDVSLSRVETG